MAEYAYQRHPQDHGESSYQPTYPPQAAPPMDRGDDDLQSSYAFGVSYENSRGGGMMRGGPIRGRAPYQRGGANRGRGYHASAPTGYNRGYQEVDTKPQYHEREDWGPSSSGGCAGPVMPPQSYPQRPPPPPQVPRASTILIHNLPSHVTEQDLYNHFGSAGMIKISPRTRNPEVWLGPQVGEARITFRDPQVAVNAVQWYNNGDFQGNMIHVEMDESMEPSSMGRMPDRGGRGGPSGMGGHEGPNGPPQYRGDRYPPQRGGGGGYGGPMRDGRGDLGRNFEKRDGDWTCENPDCHNTNFKWRMECNRCRAPRPQDVDGDYHMNGGNYVDGDGYNMGPPPFSHGARGGRGYPPRGMGGPPPMGRGGYGGRGRGLGPMRERGGAPMRGRGGYNSNNRGSNGNWRSRPY